MLLSLADSASTVAADLRASFPSLLDDSALVREYVDGELREWESATSLALQTAFPFALHEGKLQAWQRQLHAPPFPDERLGEAVNDFASCCKAVGHPANEKFWRDQFSPKHHQTSIARKLAENSSISVRLLLAQWRKHLDQARAQWELDQIETRRAALKAELERILRLLYELRERLSLLGLDTGVLLDLSKGKLCAQDIAQFERWAKYLAEDKGVRALCDMLGKMRQIALSERIERIHSVRAVQVQVPDMDSKEEIVGLRFGRDIEHALPSELALLADPETAVLFDLKYVESSLMCFDMQGMQDSHQLADMEDEHPVTEAEKLGPMIICIDTSGSMRGTPETIAKAVALYFASSARAQKRPCYLINFSTSVDVCELGGKDGMDAVLRFLKMSFHGGTDVAPALVHALELMERDRYKNADLLIVSDFVMSELDAGSLKRIEQRRCDGNRFYSLVVGACFMQTRLQTHFDKEWIYEPDRARINELVGFERGVSEAADLYRF